MDERAMNIPTFWTDILNSKRQVNGKLSLEVQIDVDRSPLTRFQISLLTAKQTWHNLEVEVDHESGESWTVKPF